MNIPYCARLRYLCESGDRNACITHAIVCTKPVVA